MEEKYYPNFCRFVWLPKCHRAESVKYWSDSRLYTPRDLEYADHILQRHLSNFRQWSSVGVATISNSNEGTQ